MALPVPSVRKEHLTLVLENAMLYLGSFHFCLLIHLPYCMYYYASFSFLLTVHPTKWTYGYLVMFCKGTIALDNFEAGFVAFILSKLSWLLCLSGFGGIYWYAFCYVQKWDFFATKILLLEMNIPLNPSSILHTDK